MFLADLARAKPGECELAFVRARSYGDGTQSSGDVTIEPVGPDSFDGRDVVIVDTILDSGHTVAAVIEYLKSQNPSTIRTCVLLDKACRREATVFADFVGWTVPDEFLVGYGLDYAGRYRGLDHLAIL
jgi:hypoxanthine phosphoribosyltransferase